MSTLLLLLVIAVAVAAGCYVGQKHLVEMGECRPSFSKDYFTGLNYLLNEQPDKAVDVFTKLLHIDSETVETHLALGSLFRRRGEIGKAIKIHQNLIARPQLPNQQRIAALVSLGKDYLQAGLIDRAERLFLEITSINNEPLVSLHYLLCIYQQQKKWESAIKVANQLKKISDEPVSLQIAIAHYYCELAQVHLGKRETDSALKALKSALKHDAGCVRASLLLGEIFFSLQQYKTAVTTFQEILKQDRVLFSESLKILSASYKALNMETQCMSFLAEEFSSEENINIALYLTAYYRESGETEKALDYLTNYLQKFPSLKGLDYLVEFKKQYHLENNSDSQNSFGILKDIIKNLLKNFSHYRCAQCGFKSSQLIWLCPGCKQWGEIKPINY